MLSFRRERGVKGSVEDKKKGQVVEGKWWSRARIETAGDMAEKRKVAG